MSYNLMQKLHLLPHTCSVYTKSAFRFYELIDFHLSLKIKQIHTCRQVVTSTICTLCSLQINIIVIFVSLMLDARGSSFISRRHFLYLALSL